MSPPAGQTWDNIIKVMTSATVRFELLSTVHTSPVSEREPLKAAETFERSGQSDLTPVCF